VVQGILDILPRVKAIANQPNLKITPIGNQAIFVKASVDGVIREGVIAAALTGLMILLFLGSWRSTVIIAVSIPLSILTSIILLSLLGQTINIMTLGGLALAVGILVDDATVTIENIERYLEEGHGLHDAILEGAAQISVPALVSTLSICIVFLPMFFLTGVARYLFVPLAEAVVFAMLASYLLSRTLVPTLAMYLLKAHDHHAAPSQNIFARLQRGFERGFEAVRASYEALLARLVAMRKLFIPLWLLGCVVALLLIPVLGQNFFPNTDNGSFILHIRARTGTRIEETASLCDQIEQSIRQTVPPAQIDNILDNIGLPYSVLNTQHATSGLFGAGAARCHANSPAPRSTFYPPTSSRRSSTSACPHPSTFRSTARTMPATAASQPRCSRSCARCRAWSTCACNSLTTTPHSTSTWTGPRPRKVATHNVMSAARR
jgi:multidrug efflux pump subunit AcrB